MNKSQGGRGCKQRLAFTRGRGNKRKTGQSTLPKWAKEITIGYHKGHEKNFLVYNGREIYDFILVM